MLHLFDENRDLFATWAVIRYEREGEAYLLQLTAVLSDGSRLQIRDYIFADGSRKYAYQWMEPDGTLRRRWDNAPHWPTVSTKPHHMHLPNEAAPAASTITNLEDLIAYLRTWFEKRAS